MNKKNIIILSILGFLLGAFAFFNLSYSKVAAQSNEYVSYFCSRVEIISAELNVEVRCYDEFVPSPPTATLTATATEVRPTETLVPSPTATMTNTVPIEPFASAPLCSESVHALYHNPNGRLGDKAHSLWESNFGCHFDHHHGDDPTTLDYKFGTQIYEYMQGEISYPWMTYSVGADGTLHYENDMKHAGYFWHVRDNIPCDDVPAPCVTAFRVLNHQHATGRDAPVRYHSYVIEYQTSDGGYALFGGWADCGDLHSPEGTIIIDEVGNVDSLDPNSTSPGRHKQHAPQGSVRTGIIWYCASQQVVGQNNPRGFITLSTSIHDQWDYTSQTNPGDFEDYVCFPDSRCRNNATTLRPHLIGLNMVRTWDSIIDADGDGIVNWIGYADRYGRILPDGTCTELGTDCAPVIFSNLRAGQRYPTSSGVTANGYKDFDIYFNNQSSGWNQPIP